MSRLIGCRGGIGALAASIALLHGGCRVWYELVEEDLIGAGAIGGDSSSDGGDPASHAGASAGGSGGGGGVSAGSGGTPSGGSDDPGGQGGEDSNTAGDGGVGGDGGMGAGGESPVGSLPPLPCPEPLVWWTDFSSDPTALDGNGDAQPDWVIRGGEPFVTAEIASGVWRPTTSKALDTFPPVNFTGRTQARVSMRDTNQTAPSPHSEFGGALFWINLDYQASDFLAVFSSITTRDGASYELGMFARNGSLTETVAGPLNLASNAFVLLELDFDPASGMVTTWVDGALLPIALPNRNTSLNLDHFATAIAPQGTGEFDELWVATCTP